MNRTQSYHYFLSQFDFFEKSCKLNFQTNLIMELPKTPTSIFQYKFYLESLVSATISILNFKHFALSSKNTFLLLELFLSFFSLQKTNFRLVQPLWGLRTVVIRKLEFKEFYLNIQARKLLSFLLYSQ